MSKGQWQKGGRTPAQPAPVAPVAAHRGIAPWKRHGLRVLAVWLLALLAWVNSFGGQLIFDNLNAIVQDPRIRELSAENVHLILSAEYWYKSTTTGLYRPLTTFSYLVNYAVFGNAGRPAGYHVVNLLLHFANILLVYLLGLAVFEEVSLAWALAALWGVHPLLTEAVTNVVGRADLLAAFGVLAGLLCYIRGPRWWAGLALCATVAIFSKEAGAVLPGLMVLHDFTYGRRRLAAYAFVLVPFAAYAWLRWDMLSHSALGAIPFVDNPLVGVGFVAGRFTAVKVIGKYLALFLWPRKLSPDYSYNAVPLATWGDAGAWLALAVCLGAVILAAACYRRSRPVFFFIAFFFITVAPVANIAILIGTVMAERFMYLPAVGVAACAVVAVERFCRRLPAAALPTVLAGICVLLAARTYARNQDWRDDPALWTSAVAAVPNSFKAHTWLASALYASGHLDQAAREADRSIEILDALPDQWNTPQPYASAALYHRLQHEDPHRTLALLLRGEKADEAQRKQIIENNLAHGRKAVAAGWMPLYLELGRTYLELGDPAKALEPLAYGRAHSTDPEFVIESANAWRAKGEWEQGAIVLCEGALKDPGSESLSRALVKFYSAAAPAGCAVQQSGSESSINMSCPMVRGHLCVASRNLAADYRQSGDPAKAASTMTMAVRDLGCPASTFAK